MKEQNSEAAHTDMFRRGNSLLVNVYGYDEEQIVIRLSDIEALEDLDKRSTTVATPSTSDEGRNMLDCSDLSHEQVERINQWHTKALNEAVTKAEVALLEKLKAGLPTELVEGGGWDLPTYRLAVTDFRADIEQYLEEQEEQLEKEAE